MHNALSHHEKAIYWAAVAVAILVIGLIGLNAAHLIDQHFHIGYNPATDNECRSMVVQWCRQGSGLAP